VKALRILAAASLLAACSGGGGGTPAPAATPQSFLTADDVQRVIAQAVGEARARGLRAQVAVVDRVGNVLAIFSMEGAGASTLVSSGLGVSGGLENAHVPTAAAAVSKAITASYLSSNGNAFTTRTANQIIQEHFDPDEAQQPSGPLYGVQFSQLACSDVIVSTPAIPLGPRPAPLGLAADPGGVPLYKGGVLVGGVGVEADNLYGIDRVITDVDADPEEAIAVAASFRFEAPDDIRANRITADGRTLRFADSPTLASDPAAAPAFATLAGALVALAPYNTGVISPGREFGTPASGVRAAASGANADWILVDATNANRYPARAGTDAGLTAGEVEALLAEATSIARRARGQIRRPLGSSAEVTVSVVDSAGVILGVVRTPDAPLFGIDVAVQKARTAAAFSGGGIAAWVDLAPAAAFLGGAAFDGSIAWSARAVGNLHRPTFPDGIEGSPHGPFSTPMASWSPFNVGLQLDLVIARLVGALGGETAKGCVDLSTPDRGIANGIQVFPGSVPIDRGGRLVGAIGVSGDGVDQDDMVAFLGLANAGRTLATGLANASAGMRADTLAPLGTRLRYVQCPQSPFNASTEQNACAGL
jgi:uncharacterized protein GlcG (DUF336 family)